jgi:uncharacterized protein DUF2252
LADVEGGPDTSIAIDQEAETGSVAPRAGRGDAFDRAIESFADAYADQNERDYEAFLGAVRSEHPTAVTAM